VEFFKSTNGGGELLFDFLIEDIFDPEEPDVARRRPA
jgi:hypothetical protein